MSIQCKQTQTDVNNGKKTEGLVSFKCFFELCNVFQADFDEHSSCPKQKAITVRSHAEETEELAKATLWFLAEETEEYAFSFLSSTRN